MKTTEKPTYSFVSNVRFLWDDAIRNHRRVIVLTVLCPLIQVGINLAELFIAPMILSQIEVGASIGALLAVIGGFTALMFVLRWCGDYFGGLYNESRSKVRMRLYDALLHKANTTAYPNAADPDCHKRLNAASDCNNSNSKMTHIWQSLSNLLINVIGLVVYVVLLSRVNLWLILVSTGTAVAGFFANRAANQWSYRHRKEESEYNHRINYIARAAESTELAKDIRIFGLVPWLKEIHAGGMRALEAFIHRRSKVYIFTTVADLVLNLLRNGIAYMLLIHMALGKGLPASEFLLYFSAVGGFTAWVQGVFMDLTSLHRESLDMSTFREYYEMPEPFTFEGGALPARGRAHTLELRDVSFTYPGADEPIFQHVNLTLAAGEKLAVVGLNGAGKTTFVRLLCGLYDPDEGTVLLDGTDIRSLDRRAYYALFPSVFQEYSVLEATVAENVAASADEIDTRRVWACLTQAGIADVVRALPNGVDTHLGRMAFDDGVLLSGGQIQRLMLARALYKNGDVLVLDEPTAALDPIAEHELYQEYNRMTEGKSAVFISHRLASTRFCDRIVYLANGRVAEEGTHEQLLARGGDYAHLFEVQSRYYREGG